MDSIEELSDRLRRRGHAQRMVTTAAEADAWRARAREAADKLGRPVQTMQGGLLVLAVLKDWPANELETAAHRTPDRQRDQADAHPTTG